MINLNNYPQRELNGATPTKLRSMAVGVPAKADVVVAGAGINGLFYAIRLKSVNPSASIVVLERSDSPTYKVGESTLNTFMQFVSKNVLSPQYLLRLFTLKEGLDFVLLDRNGIDIEYHDAGGLTHTVQLERQMSELLLTLKAQRLGIKVFYGVTVDGNFSDFLGASKKIFYSNSFHEPANITNPERSRFSLNLRERPINLRFTKTAFTEKLKSLMSPKRSMGSIDEKLQQNIQNPLITSKFVVDASGLRKIISSKHSVVQRFEGTNINAYWCYMTEDFNVPINSVRNWDYAATNHICFAEGWSWWIRMLSWRHTPIPNKIDMINYLLDLYEAEVPADQLPCTAELAAQFGCTFEPITSVGFAIRDETDNDVDFPVDSALQEKQYGPDERRFWAIANKYKILRDVINSPRYSVIPKSYDSKSYWVFKKISFFQKEACGNGWLALGNAAVFTSPIFSPGINFIGLPMSIFAANLTGMLLNGELTEKDVETKFTAFVQNMAPVARLHDLLFYFGYRNLMFFRWMLTTYMATAASTFNKMASDLPEMKDVPLTPFMMPEFAKFASGLVPLMQGSSRDVPSAAEVAKVIEFCKATLADLKDLLAKVPFGMLSRHYNNDFTFNPNKLQRLEGCVDIWRCAACHNANFGPYKMHECVRCGHAKKADNVEE
ncbi:hypothetical protein HDU82_003947 [Entophlyctis luteolus]|nr:hypothetical protein HDU82_003947 [Entophlyctis luteolus]